MSILSAALERIPPATEAGGAVVVLSGGLDSTVSLRLAVERYGAVNVVAVSFLYGQKQKHEILCAAASCERLGVAHNIINLSFMADINKGFSANTDATMEMPTIADVIGDPAPVTYVANRNMIMMSIASAIAETRGLSVVICGLQSNDNYNYHDTTPVWLGKLNSLLDENRKTGIKVIAPFVDLSKTEEIAAVLELDGNLDLFASTLTCYNPDEHGASCGNCPSCAERLQAFASLDLVDPVQYQLN